MHYDTSRRVSDTRWLPKDKGIQLLSFVLSPHKIYYVWPVHDSLPEDVYSGSFFACVFEKHVRKSYGSFEMIDRSLFISTSSRSPFLEWNLYHHFGSISVRSNPFDIRSFTRPNKGKTSKENFPFERFSRFLNFKRISLCRNIFRTRKRIRFSSANVNTRFSSYAKQTSWFPIRSGFTMANCLCCICICIKIWRRKSWLGRN